VDIRARLKSAALCPNCWAHHEPDRVFCHACGATLERARGMAVSKSVVIPEPRAPGSPLRATVLRVLLVRITLALQGGLLALAIPPLVWSSKPGRALTSQFLTSQDRLAMVAGSHNTSSAALVVVGLLAFGAVLLVVGQLWLARWLEGRVALLAANVVGFVAWIGLPGQSTALPLGAAIPISWVLATLTLLFAIAPVAMPGKDRAAEKPA
jgi:hypothetical protein